MYNRGWLMKLRPAMVSFIALTHADGGHLNSVKPGLFPSLGLTDLSTWLCFPLSSGKPSVRMSLGGCTLCVPSRPTPYPKLAGSWRKRKNPPSGLPRRLSDGNSLSLTPSEVRSPPAPRFANIHPDLDLTQRPTRFWYSFINWASFPSSTAAEPGGGGEGAFKEHNFLDYDKHGSVRLTVEQKRHACRIFIL